MESRPFPFHRNCTLCPKQLTTAFTVTRLMAVIKQLNVKTISYCMIVTSGKSSQGLANELPSLAEIKKLGKYILPSWFFDDPADVGSLISGSSVFAKTSLNIWKFTVHVLLKPGLENFEHYFTSMWDECNCVVVWAFFGIAFLRDWNENWPSPVLWPLLCSKFAGILSAALSQHHLSGFEIAQLEFHHIH